MSEERRPHAASWDVPPPPSLREPRVLAYAALPRTVTVRDADWAALLGDVLTPDRPPLGSLPANAEVWTRPLALSLPRGLAARLAAYALRCGLPIRIVAGRLLAIALKVPPGVIRYPGLPKRGDPPQPRPVDTRPAWDRRPAEPEKPVVRVLPRYAAADTLKARREALGLSQRDLADAAVRDGKKLQRSQVGEMERGRRDTPHVRLVLHETLLRLEQEAAHAS